MQCVKVVGCRQQCGQGVGCGLRLPRQKTERVFTVKARAPNQRHELVMGVVQAPQQSGAMRSHTLRELVNRCEYGRHGSSHRHYPRAEMQAIVSGDKFDRARAQSLLEEKTRAVQANSPEVITALADFYDSLNAEQQQKVRDLMQRRKGWMARG